MVLYIKVLKMKALIAHKSIIEETKEYVTWNSVCSCEIIKCAKIKEANQSVHENKWVFRCNFQNLIAKPILKL